jgi:glycosyltransferase involved in cell wall biosynthesis
MNLNQPHSPKAEWTTDDPHAPGALRVRKVLITGPLLTDPGGVANYYSNVLPVLRRSGRFDLEYFEIGSSRGAAGPFHPIVDQMRIRNALARNRFDLLHVNPSLTLKSFLRDGFIIRRASRHGLPVLVFFRGWEEEVETQIQARWRWLFRSLYGRTSMFMVLASRFGEKLREWGITAPIELATTAVGDSTLGGFSIEDKVQAMRNTDELRVLFLARLEPAKGVLETLEGVAQLVRAGRRVRLTVAGVGPAMDDLRRAIESSADLKARVKLAGYVRGQERADLFSSHHVYCLPTTYGEGMPNSLLEAMAFGMTVVTCGVGGIKDFFRDPAMGCLVPEVSGTTIADKLCQLLDAPERMADIARYNHRYAQENFLASRVGHRLLAIYDKVLSRHGGAGIA